MLILSIILLVVGIILISISSFVAYRQDIDLREKIYLPGVLFVLIGCNLSNRIFRSLSLYIS